MNMWLLKTSFLLFLSLSLAQEDSFSETLKRLRQRRPQTPRVVGIDNEDGIVAGRPVPFRQERQQGTAQLLAAAFHEQPNDLNRPNSALESLIATAARDEDVSPILQEIPAVPIQDSRAQVPSRQRSRIPPSVPRRSQRPLPRHQSQDDEIKGDAAPTKSQRPRQETIKTTERYSHKNDDGSFTFGYVSEDGSFREETRGVDCITRGKYGYIDPEGKKREFTYVSGLPCNTTSEDEDDFQVQDTIDPSERFRTSPAVQLNDNQLPTSTLRQRQRVRRPQQQQQRQQQQQQRQQPQQQQQHRQPQPQQQQRQPQRTNSDFPSFQRNREPTSRPRPTPGSNSAFNNLLAIVDDQPASPTTPSPPSPTRGQPTTLRPRPTTPSPRPTTFSPRPTPSSNFDFDATLGEFEVSRPALTFDSPSSPKPSFSSEFAFDPEKGTFQTDLRQNINGQTEIKLSNAAAPASRPATTRPTPSSFTSFGSTTPSPPSPSPFTPLNFPDPESIRIPSSTASPSSPSRPTETRPTPSSVGSTVDGNDFFFQSFPSSTPATPAKAPTTTRPVTRPPPPPPSPTSSASRPPPPPPRDSTPQVQFGFNPIGSSSPSRPFTAFANGLPPQLSGSPPPQFQSRPPPQQFQSRPPPPQQFQSRPPPPQQQQQFQTTPQQFQQFQQFQQPNTQFRGLGIPPPLPQSNEGRFGAFGRPAPPQQQSQRSQAFAVFNPAAFRGGVSQS